MDAIDYDFGFSLQDDNITVSLNKTDLFNAKTSTNTSGEIDVGGVMLKDLQTFAPDRMSNIDVIMIKTNVSKLNDAFNDTFAKDGAAFITDFKKNYSNALNKVVNSGNSIANSATLDVYQTFTKFLYYLKRSIGIAYMILTMYESVAPENSNELKDLETKEKYLKKFLTDSVGLILNTNEWIDNVSQV